MLTGLFLALCLLAKRAGLLDGGGCCGGVKIRVGPSACGRQGFDRPTVATLINQFKLIQLTAFSQYC